MVYAGVQQPQTLGKLDIKLVLAGNFSLSFVISQLEVMPLL